MRLHKRTIIVQRARNELAEFLLNLEEKHELTIGEILCLLSNEAAHFAVAQIREDRHPDDPDKKADEA